MRVLLLIILSLFFTNCNKNNFSVKSLNLEFEITTFDVVQKQLIIKGEMPEHLRALSSEWFDERVKTNGLEGELIFTISNFVEEISLVSDGKRVDVYLTFSALVNKPSLSHTKIIEGEVTSFGILTGDFSLAEFDTVIQNTQSDLILRLSRDLKSKI